LLSATLERKPVPGTGHWSGTILVVEEHLPIRTNIMKILTRSRFQTMGASTGEEGLELFDTQAIDLILLDILLPGMDGFELCRSIRACGKQMAIIMLSSLGDTKHLVRGLAMGADDYVTMPFQPEELVARIKAVLRREREMTVKASQLTFRNLKMDYHSRKCFKNGLDLDLTPTEFQLLTELCATPGKAVSRSTLSSHIWGGQHHGCEKSLDVYIARLRQKVEDAPGEPSLIRTVRGYGYLCE